VTQPEDAPGTVGGFLGGVRERLRGSALALLSVPVLFDLVSELGLGRLTPALSAAGAGALLVGALLRVRRRDRASVGQGAVMAGLAAGLVALGGGGYGIGVSLLFALATGFGTMLAYGPAKERVLPDIRLPTPPAPPPPDIELPPLPPVQDPAAAALSGYAARITALGAARVHLPRGAFAESIARIAETGQALLHEARADPVDFARVQAFLDLYLDQIESLVMRYGQARPAGETALPDGLAAVLGDLEKAFDTKLAELRAHDLQALDIEVQNLARRLSEQLAPLPRR
jgi:hypothetical protein